jgi:hypothetical protein
MTDEKADMETFGTAVFDLIGELTRKGETRLDPDSPEGIELRKAANAAMGGESEYGCKGSQVSAPLRGLLWLTRRPGFSPDRCLSRLLLGAAGRC